MPKLDGYSLSFPILAGKLHSNKEDIEIEAIIGTSFCIGHGLYITAGHVLEEANEYEVFALGVTQNSKPWLAAKIETFEIKKEADIGVFKAQHQIGKAYGWSRQYVSNLTDIVASGYPHALCKDPASIYRRDFKGYIITRRPSSRLDLMPQIYELSISCPKGISGSFVIDDKTGKICAIIIGANKSSIDLHYVTEELIEQDGKSIYHKTETSTYGIAVSTKDLMPLEFDLLKGSIEDHLRANNMLDDL